MDLAFDRAELRALVFRAGEFPSARTRSSALLWLDGALAFLSLPANDDRPGPSERCNSRARLHETSTLARTSAAAAAAPSADSTKPWQSVQ